MEKAIILILGLLFVLPSYGQIADTPKAEQKSQEVSLDVIKDALINHKDQYDWYKYFPKADGEDWTFIHELYLCVADENVSNDLHVQHFKRAIIKGMLSEYDFLNPVNKRPDRNIVLFYLDELYSMKTTSISSTLDILGAYSDLLSTDQVDQFAQNGIKTSERLIGNLNKKVDENYYSISPDEREEIENSRRLLEESIKKFKSYIEME